MPEASSSTHVTAVSVTGQDAPERALLRHMLATVAYRAEKVVRGAPPEFQALRVEASLRTPLEILAHMGDLFDWALTMAQDRTVWKDATPLAWDLEVARFFDALTTFDLFLASAAPVKSEAIARLVQGPAADALTHIGQLAMLRRLVGKPIRGESYARAEISAGRTGLSQAPAKYEFD